MKTIILSLFLSLTQATFSQDKPSLEFIKGLGGKNPVELNLIENKDVKTRLQKIMKEKDLAFFQNAWGYGEPIQIKNDVAYINVIGANRAAGRAELFIDFKSNLIFAVVGSIYVENPALIFSENKSKKVPEAIAKLFRPY